MLFLQVLSLECVIPASFPVLSMLFLQVLVCEVRYSYLFWSVKCGIPARLSVPSVWTRGLSVPRVWTRGLSVPSV